MNEAQAELVRVRCRVCATITEHRIQCRFETTAAPALELEPGPRPLFVCIQAQILECQGCANISFRKGWAYAKEAEQPRWTIYPDPEQREPFAAVALLPANVAKLYRETLQAIAGRCFTLAAGGMRAVVEAICQLHGCKGQDLQQKISKLKGNNGVLGTREATALHSHRIFGNEAMHRMRQPSPTEIYEALEILEHVLRTLYELPYRADNLARMHAERIRGEVTKIAALRLM